MADMFHGIDIRTLDLDSWPTVDEAGLSEMKVGGYRRRKAAMETLIEARDVNSAAKVGECTPQEIGRIFRRCTGMHHDKRIVGFRGCVPYYATKKYTLGDKTTTGTAGLLGRVFRLYHQSVEVPLTDFVLGRSKKLEDPSLPEASDIRDKFLDLCEEAGIPLGEYPRRTEEGGLRSLLGWRRRLIDTHGREYNDAHFGSESASNFDDGTEAYRLPCDPHRIFVFDEYTIDTFHSLQIVEPDGSADRVAADRFKVINGIRRGSHDVVTCRRVLRKEPDTAQFLEAVESSIRPHARREFSIPGYVYPDGPCFSSDIPKAEWLVPDIILLDNSKVHHAKQTRISLTRGLGCMIIYGVVKRPKARNDIENWHSGLAATLRKLKSTTATKPTDPRRKNPEAMAVKLRLEEDHIAQLLELRQAMFARTRLKSLKGKSPMENFQLWACDANTILRQLPAQDREQFCLAELRVEVNIWCDEKGGGQPVVRHFYAEYIGPKLGKMRARNGEKCTLILNKNAAHIGRLFEIGPNATEIDIVRTRGIWCEPHRYRDRAMYRQLLAEKKISPASREKSPIRLLAEYLAANATNRSTALVLADLLNSQKLSAEQQEAAPEAITPEPEHEEIQDPIRLKSSGAW